MYQIIFSKKIEKILEKFNKNDRQLFNQFMSAFDKISANPYCAKSLLGNLKGYYSYRVRDYRIIFEIEKDRLIICIEKIEHRKDVYKS